LKLSCLKWKLLNAVISQLCEVNLSKPENVAERFGMKALDILVTFMLVLVIFGMLPIGILKSAPMLMQEELAGNVTYITGGVGEAEAAVMRDMAKDYLLEVTFMQKRSGQKEEFLADVAVQIQDEQQKVVLDVTTDGPFLLANLPVGNYLVIAWYNGEAKQQKINVDVNKHQKVVFSWLLTQDGQAL
jgi:hypothetical protein